MKKSYAELSLLQQEGTWYFKSIPQETFGVLEVTEEMSNAKNAANFVASFSTEDGEDLADALCRLVILGEQTSGIYEVFTIQRKKLYVKLTAELIFMNAKKKEIFLTMMDVTSFVEDNNDLKWQLYTLENMWAGGLCKVVMDDDLTILWHNQRFLDMIGYTKKQFEEELHGFARGYVYPEDEKRVAEALTKVREKFGESESLEVRILRRNKETRTCLITFSKAYETEEGIPVFYSSGIDITERKYSQQLAWEKEKLQIALQQTSSCVWEYDILQKCILDAEGFCELLGIHGKLSNVPDSLIERGVVCKESEADFRWLFQEICHGTDKVERIIKFRKSNGMYLWSRISMQCVFNDLGIPIKGITMMEDITEKYYLEQRYQIEEEKRRSFGYLGTIFACQLNLTEDTVMDINKKAFPGQEHFQYASTFMQQNVISYIHPDDRVRFMETFGCDQLVDSYQQGVSEHSLEYRALDSRGNALWQQTIAHVIKEPLQGNILAYFYIKNIDEQMSAGIELKERTERDRSTGLYHRYVLETKCRKLFENKEKEQTGALFRMELGGCTCIKEHITRDEVGKIVADIIKEVFSEANTIAGRMGKDGFMVYLPKCDTKEQAKKKAKQLLKKFADKVKQNDNLFLSVGLALYPQDGLDYESLYQCTDIALYHAKHFRKNYYIFYDLSMIEQAGTDMFTVSREWLLDKANDIIYIADLHTYEMLYMNSNMKKLFHQDDSYRGKKCHMVLQGLDHPCQFCTNSLLSRDEFYHWTYYNPIIGQTLILKDRIVNWYGQPARIEFATNVSEIDSLRIKAEEQNKTILSSIEYAGKIQRNLLPKETLFREVFSDYSIIWSPKDRVGGDIYWLEKFSAGALLCVCDCTGHGTPGSLLTMLVASILKDIVNEDNCMDTPQILQLLDERIANVLHVDTESGSNRKQHFIDFEDGCDLAALFIGKDGSVTISCGNMHVYFCNGTEVTKIKGQRLHIGEGQIKNKDMIEKVVIPADRRNKFYIGTDGLYDQIGGEPPRPFGYKVFEKLILDYHGETQNFISEKIWDAFTIHQGEQQRRDDVQLISFSI